MAETSTVARPYAKAAFEYARDHQALDRWSEWLGKVSRVVASHDVQSLLSSPKLSPERKVELVIAVADVELDEAAQRFLSVLGEKGRLPTLATIDKQFERLRAEHEQRVEVARAMAMNTIGLMDPNDVAMWGRRAARGTWWKPAWPHCQTSPKATKPAPSTLMPTPLIVWSPRK